MVCADFPDVPGGVPPGRPAVGVYKVPVPSGCLDDYSPTALFPHGAQKPKIKVGACPCIFGPRGVCRAYNGGSSVCTYDSSWVAAESG